MNGTAQRQIVHRLRRARGQIDGVIAMLESGRDCRDLVTQLSAASRALSKAGYLLIATNMQESLLDESSDPELTPRELQRLFMTLT